MKVILSAYACEPHRGSEPGVGWNVARCLSQKHSLTIITRCNNRKVIESSGEPWITGAKWEYVDPPRWLTFWKKGGRGTQLFYVLWQIAAFYRVKAILHKEKHDVVHHVTFGKYWVPSFLASLPVPFVFGPVGGGERTPEGLLPDLGFKARTLERAQQTLKHLIPRLPGFRNLYNKAAWTFAATAQTEDELRKLGVSRISVLPQSGIGDDEVDSYVKRHSTNPSHIQQAQSGQEIRLVTACRLIRWKAVDLAIEAVALARRRGTKVRLTILQTGPELESLINLTRKLEITDCVEFLGRLPTLENVYRKISDSDALIHPAVHEAFGQACLEAMALGVPVICLDWGGPGMIVDHECGFLITPSDRTTTIKALADSIQEVEKSPESIIRMRRRAVERAYHRFKWMDLTGEIDRIYTRITKPISNT